MNLIKRGDEGLMPLVGDLTGHTLVLSHERLNRRYQMPRFQIFKATGGFGCKEGSLGRAVYGIHIADNEDARWNRNDFIGIATQELAARAMEDVRPVPPLNLDERGYFLWADDGSSVMGDTVSEAMQRLRRITSAKVRQAFLTHPESHVNEFGYLVYPQGTEPTEVKIKKKGGSWIDAT